MGEWLLSPTGKYSDSNSGCLAGWLKAGNGKLDGLMERKEISFFFFLLCCLAPKSSVLYRGYSDPMVKALCV